MILTGTSYRPFYPQTSLNWVSDFTPINIEEESNFYISGSGKELIYTLKNNKIYSSTDELISTYNNNQLINFSGNISESSFDLYKDNLPLFLGKKRSFSGDVNGFIFELKNNSSINLDSISILGEQPEYFVDNNIIYKSGAIIPINISHSGEYDIFIYSGVSNDDNFTISGADNLAIPPNNISTVYLINNTDFIPNQKILSIDLYTNIGLENLFINISGEPVIPSNLFYINLSPPVNGIFAGSSLNYVLSFANESGSNIEVSLEYVSGVTGDYYKKVSYTRAISGVPISGFVSGAGVIVNTVTGLLSGYNNLRDIFEYGTGSGLIGSYKLAEDKVVTGFYSTLGTGRGNVNFITDIRGTGQAQNIIYSGYITYQGGILTGTTGNLFGSGIIANQRKLGNIEDATSTIFQPWTGNILATFNPDEYETVSLVSPVRFVTGTFRQEIKNLLGFAYATGGRHSGKLQGNFGSEDFEPGKYWFSKPFTGPVTGAILEYTGFNPVTMKIETTPTTGFISTTIYQYILAQGCKIDLEFELTGTGLPSTVRKFGDTGIIFPIDIFNTIPIKTPLEWEYENSNFQINSGTVSVYPYYPTGGRTRISRLGDTLSGTGIFDNVFQKPLFTGYIITGESGRIISGAGVNFYGWKESIASTETIINIDGKPSDLAYFSGQMGIFDYDDYTITNFTITGDPFVEYTDIGFRFDNPSETGKLLIAEFYQTDYISGRKFSGVGIPNGEMTLVSYDSGNLDVLNSPIYGTFTSVFGAPVENPPTNIIINDLGTKITKFLGMYSGAAFFKSDLGEIGQKYFDVRNLNFQTGNYFVKNYFIDLTPSLVTAGLSFSHLSYIACEKNKEAVFQIKKTPGLYQFFEISGKIVGKFTGPNYPIVSQDTLINGLTWNFVLSANDSEQCFCFPIYQNTQYNVAWNMNLELSVDQASLKYYDPLKVINNFILLNTQSVIQVRDDDKEECIGCADGVCQSTIQDCDCQQPTCFGSRCNVDIGECIDTDICFSDVNGPPPPPPEPPIGPGTTGVTVGDGGDDDGDGDPDGEGDDTGDPASEAGPGQIGPGDQKDNACYVECDNPFTVELQFGEVKCYGGSCGSSGYRVPVKICAKNSCDTGRYDVEWSVPNSGPPQKDTIRKNGCVWTNFYTKCIDSGRIIANGQASGSGMLCKDQDGKIKKVRSFVKIAPTKTTPPPREGACCNTCCDCQTNGIGYESSNCDGKCTGNKECAVYRQVDCACCKKTCYYCKTVPPQPPTQMAALRAEDLNFILEILK